MKTAIRTLLIAAVAAGVVWSVLSLRDAQNEAVLLKTGSSMEARFLQSLEETNTGLMDVLQGSDIILDASPAACRIFGYSSMAGIKVSDILPPEFREIHEAKMRAAMSHPHAGAMRCWGRRSDGQALKLSVRVHISSNGVQAFVNLADEVTFNDMTGPMNTDQDALPKSN
jgi:PAS domain S-box-containing protein